MPEHAVGAKAAEIEIEVAMDRCEAAEVEARVPFVQSMHRFAAGRIVVARDIEPGEGRGQLEGGKMVGRKPGYHGQQRQHGFEPEDGLKAFGEES